MKIKEIKIHNFRSIIEESIRLGNYSLLIGANNSGKSNLIDALRIFYEKDLKFDLERDFPKLIVTDKESWMEIEYELSESERKTIKNSYLTGEKTFRIRKWLMTDDKNKNGIFGYEKETLSSELFYGWKNVGQSKLGKIIYIPAVSKLEEHTKLSGPSALRDLIHDILKPIIKTSSSFSELKTAFGRFSEAFKVEKTKDGRSLEGLESIVNDHIKPWGTAFTLRVDTPDEDVIVKNLIKHVIKDNMLDKEMTPECFGSGFQRYLIYALIQISAIYSKPDSESKKSEEFSPSMELLLFEEPEAFLHPPQQTVLDASLRRLGERNGNQILAATHSPIFVSCNVEDIPQLILVQKTKGETQVKQLSEKKLKEIFEDNQAIAKILSKNPDEDLELQIELETAKHVLWLNPERCGLFFSNHVLIVEGTSEQALINGLIKDGKVSVPPSGTFILEVLGKFNIHRFMNMLGELGIEHSVLYDDDKTGEEKTQQEAVNKLIQNSKNRFTFKIDSVSPNLESFLQIPIPSSKDQWKKPARIFRAYKKNTIDEKKLNAYIAKLEALLPSQKDGMEPADSKPVLEKTVLSEKIEGILEKDNTKI